MNNQVYPEERIVITGIGLTAPNGNNLKEFRESLLAGKSGVQKFKTRYVGEVLAGICDFDTLKYQKKRNYVEGLVLERFRFIAVERQLAMLESI